MTFQTAFMWVGMALSVTCSQVAQASPAACLKLFAEFPVLSSIQVETVSPVHNGPVLAILDGRHDSTALRDSADQIYERMKERFLERPSLLTNNVGSPMPVRVSFPIAEIRAAKSRDEVLEIMTRTIRASLFQELNSFGSKYPAEILFGEQKITDPNDPRLPKTLFELLHNSKLEIWRPDNWPATVQFIFVNGHDLVMAVATPPRSGIHDLTKMNAVLNVIMSLYNQNPISQPMNGFPSDVKFSQNIYALTLIFSNESKFRLDSWYGHDDGKSGFGPIQQLLRLLNHPYRLGNRRNEMAN